MIHTIKAEFRKVLTVRSTYVLIFFMLVLEGLFGFYGNGIKAEPGQLLKDPHYLVNQISPAVLTLSVLVSLIGLLLVTHEYRYNTIMHTLTLSRTRRRVFIAKLVVISIITLLLTALLAALVPVLVYLGVQAGGHPIVHQSLSLGDLWWRVPIAAWGISIFALLLAFIIRSQVGAITVLLLLPSTIEPIFGGLLKDNQIYLPFSSLVGILQRNEAVHPPISYGHSAVIAFTYLVVGTVVALVLFQRRDAN
jgi:ABC-2 type transport system permease protein